MPLPPPPLSPHLQIYRPQWTSVMSILHRLTGTALAVGLLVLAWFLTALAGGPDGYAVFEQFMGSLVGQFMLMGWSFALCFHFCAGIRHLIFDTGRLFDPHRAEKAGKIVLASAVVLTLATWACAFNIIGGAP